MAPQNPIPQGTAYTFLLPWVDKRCSEKEIRDTIESMDWGKILKIDMIFKKPIDRKSGHYKVFIHMGSLNPHHSMVFEHLDTGWELRVNHRHGYWKVRRSQWVQRSKVELVPMAPPPLPKKLREPERSPKFTHRFNDVEFVPMAPPPLPKKLRELERAPCPPIMESFILVPNVSPTYLPGSPTYSPGSPTYSPGSPTIIPESISWGDIPMESEPSSPEYDPSKSWADIV
jgi:hypothetical protein